VPRLVPSLGVFTTTNASSTSPVSYDWSWGSTDHTTRRIHRAICQFCPSILISKPKPIVTSGTCLVPCRPMPRRPARGESETGIGSSWVPLEVVQADARCPSFLSRQQNDTSATPQSMAASLLDKVLRSNLLVLGEAQFKVAKSETSASKPGDKERWMIRTDVKRRTIVRASSNHNFGPGKGRFDGGKNYPSRLVAAQNRPRFKLWSELAYPDMMEL
jgi:hypothetical protein